MTQNRLSRIKKPSIFFLCSLALISVRIPWEAAAQATDHLRKKLWLRDHEPGRVGRSDLHIYCSRHRKAERAGFADRTHHRVSAHQSVCDNTPHYANEFTIDLPYPTAFTPELLKHARAGLCNIYRDGYRYDKAGVTLGKITPLHLVQPDLFGEVVLSEHYRQARLMAILDAINRIFGRGTLVFAVQGRTHNWRMRQERLSPRFTSRWDEILTI